MPDDHYLAKLRTYWKRHHAFPSMTKLAEIMGLATASSVFGVVGRLTEAGFLERVEGRIAPTRKFFARPLLGSVRAGQPEPATQEAPDVLNVDDYLIDDPDRTTFVTVRGDSMQGAGLLDGDVVVVETNAATKPGDIVVAVIDGDITVKTLRTDRRGFYLEPANPRYEPIVPRGSLEIVGVVIGSFRRHRR